MITAIFIRSVLIVTTSAILFAGCGGSAAPPVAPNELSALQSNIDATKSKSLVYMAQCCDSEFGNHGNITVYDSQLSAVSRIITHGISNPSFVTVDHAGSVYALEFLNCCYGVAEYDVGSQRPSRRIHARYAVAAATNATNELFVALCPACHEYMRGEGAINVYRPRSTTLFRSIKNIAQPTDLVFDTNGNVYVLDPFADRVEVLVYAPGASKPLRKLSQKLTFPSLLALDLSNDVYILASVGGQQGVVEYKAGSDKVIRTITNGLSSPQAMTLDVKGNLYVSNTPYPSNGWISVYPPNATTPSYKITSDLADPLLLVTDAEGNLYAGNDYYGVSLFDNDATSRSYGSVCVFAPQARKPTRCVSNDQYSYPYWLAVNPR